MDIASARPHLYFLAVLAVVSAVVFAARVLLQRRFGAQREMRLRVQLVMAALTFAGVLAILLALPISDALRGQLLSFLGILLSAAIALSSTTFLGNALAGILLRVVSGFRLGDFIQVDSHFGRVSERGLFHTEIQTADRDLTTLPNLFLVTHPVKVIRDSGTIVSATLSLGYDVPRSDVERSLLAAAADAGLEEPFLHVVELGDFSITYRIAGLLTDVKFLLSKRSALRSAAVDRLHGAGIEIVSPNFMTTRSLPPEHKVIASADRIASPASEGSAEAVAFDKAEEADAIEDLESAIGSREQEIEDLERRLAAASDETERATLGSRIEALQAEIARRRRESSAREKALERGD